MPDPVSEEHQRLLIEVASRAPSQLNSQPWRFVIIEEPETIRTIARISGESMKTTMSNGTFFERYKPYFRFSAAEMERRRDGMLFDKLPAPLRPFTSQVYTSRGQKLMNALRVPSTLGAENEKLVAGSPLLLGEIAKHPKWIQRPRVRVALVAHPDTPMSRALLVVPLLLKQDLELVATLPRVPSEVREASRARLAQLPPFERQPTGFPPEA